MSARNLVLEIGESESAADIQARLDTASDDGFFLVNVVGRLAFLRTTVTPKTPENLDEDARALEFLKANLGKPSRVIAADFEKETGIVRSYKWFQRRRKDKELGWPVKSV